MGLLAWLGLAPDQANLEAGLAADRQNAALSQQFNQEGVMSDADLALANTDYQRSLDQLVADHAIVNADTGGTKGVTIYNATPSGEGSFVAGAVADQAAANNKTYWQWFVYVIGLIPWPVWLGLAIATFLWMGGLDMLKGNLKGRLAGKKW